MKIFLLPVDGDAEDTFYRGEDMSTIERENGLSPNGNPIAGRWVYRDPKGVWIDMDQYRHDLFARNNLELVE